MKNIFFLLYFIFISCIAYAWDHTSNSGCKLAYLGLEGSGTSYGDASSAGNTGSASSSGHPGWSSVTIPPVLKYGSIPNSFTFDATSYINTGSTSLVAAGSPVSLGIWFYPTSTPGYNPARLFDVDGIFVVGTNNTGGTDLVLRFTGGTTLVRDSNTSAYSLNTWTFVLFTWDGSNTGANVHIYTATAASPTLTEVSYATTTNGATLTDLTGDLIIGNRISDSARSFLGQLATPFVFNRVLTVAEGQDIVNNTLKGNGSFFR